MAQAQKPDFVFRRNGRVHLNRRVRQFIRLLAAEVCASAVVMLDTPCSEVVWSGTGYPLHSPVSPSISLPRVTVCHHMSTELYQWNKRLIPTDVSLRTTTESKDKTRPQIGRRNTRTSVTGNLPMGEPHPENCHYPTKEPLKIWWTTFCHHHKYQLFHQ